MEAASLPEIGRVFFLYPPRLSVSAVTSLCRALQNSGATIAFMAKFKPVRAKPKRTAPPPGAVSCVILVLAGMLLVMLFMYFVMRNANG